MMRMHCFSLIKRVAPGGSPRRLPGLLAAGALLLAWAGAPATAFAAGTPSPEGDVLVRVDGQPITRAEVFALNPQAQSNALVANQTAQTLINRLLLNKAAKAQGLDQEPGVKAALQSAEQTVLAQAALAHHLQGQPIDEQEVKQQYETMVKQNPPHQYRVRLITVASHALAEKVLNDLKSGKRFTDLAAEHSTGPNAALGGELGWVLRPQLQASVGTALKALKPGEITGPVSVPEGWAIVQLLQKRPTEVLPLDAVRARIEQQIRNKQEADYLAQLRAQAKIEVVGAKPDQPASAASGAGAQQ